MVDFVLTTLSDALDAGATATGPGGTGLSLRAANHTPGNGAAGGCADGIFGDVGTQISLTSSTVSTHGDRHDSPRVRIGSNPEACGFRTFKSLKQRPEAASPLSVHPPKVRRSGGDPVDGRAHQLMTIRRQPPR
jgi:hypothetical protein